MNRVYQAAINSVGALASSPVYAIKAPFDCQLVHVSLSNSSANAGTCKIGKTGDDDYYLAAETFGVSNACTEVATPAGFDGAGAAGQYPHIEDGTTILVTITDHGSHMADFIVVLTFTEG